MSSNSSDKQPELLTALPDTMPVFPLPCALLLPRSELPLNIFEPRYLAMIDAALRSDRMIGMIQPHDEEAKDSDLYGIGCAGRITSFAETGDGRYVITLTGVARFQVVEEINDTALFRRCRVDFSPFAKDLASCESESQVDRSALFKALREFTEKNGLTVDWDSVGEAPSEALVNTLSMMSPFGIKEKQALLEASDLRTRADVLVAITEFALAAQDGNPVRLQ